MQDQNDALSFLENLPSDDPVRPDTVRIDTHANIVFLIGSKAYKVKRAVKYPFLDYSTLDLRHKACEAEITHNKPNAPDVYRRAVPVTRASGGDLVLAGDGEAVEWVVEMNRFETEDEFAVLAEKGPLSDVHCDQLARMMVAAHLEAPLREGEAFYQELSSYINQNDTAFHEHPELFPAEQVRHLTKTAKSTLASIHDLILNRSKCGLIRRCHGDAHLRNIVLIDGKPTLFDAIEFSEAIATNDVLYDLAFLLMDLWERGQRRAANRVFNRYLDLTQLEEQPEGLAALPFYLMMRAAIRSKIAASSALNQPDPAAKAREAQLARTYFEFALAFLEPSRPQLIAIGGLSGTGKTTLAYAMAQDMGRPPGARVLRTDVMRKRLLGLAETESAPPEAYTREASDKVYQAIDAEIQSVLAAGHSAIFDAVFASDEERRKIETVARRVEADFKGLWLEADPEILKRRVAARKGDASDATTSVVDQQLTYDLGQMTWTKVDATGDVEATIDLARDVLKPT